MEKFQEEILQNQKKLLQKSNPLGLTEQSFNSFKDDWEDQDDNDTVNKFGGKLLGPPRVETPNESLSPRHSPTLPDQKTLEKVINDGYLERQNKLKTNINTILTKPELLQTKKLSPNTFKEIEIDHKTEENIISQNTLVIKCKILKSEIHQHTNFLVLRSKLLVFKIALRIDNTSLNSEVRRLESDFYHLRSILLMTFG